MSTDKTPHPFIAVRRGGPDKSQAALSSNLLADALGDDQRRDVPAPGLSSGDAPDSEFTFVVIDPPPRLITSLDAEVQGENVVRDQRRSGAEQ